MFPIPSLYLLIGYSYELIYPWEMEHLFNVLGLEIEDDLSHNAFDYPFFRNIMLYECHN
jgi:hypothetical protein